MRGRSLTSALGWVVPTSEHQMHATRIPTVWQAIIATIQIIVGNMHLWARHGVMRLIASTKILTRPPIKVADAAKLRRWWHTAARSPASPRVAATRQQILRPQSLYFLPCDARHLIHVGICGRESHVRFLIGPRGITPAFSQTSTALSLLFLDIPLPFLKLLLPFCLTSTFHCMFVFLRPSTAFSTAFP